MNEPPKNSECGGPRILRRVIFVIACISTLVAVFYVEEKGRGKREWENCRRELEGKGATLDWAAYLPPPVQDDQNIFKAPKMAEWFVKNSQGAFNQTPAGPKTKPFSGLSGQPNGDSNDVLVAEFKMVVSGHEAGSNRVDAVWQSGSPDAHEQGQKLLRRILAPTAFGAQGMFLFVKDASEPIKTAQIGVLSDAPLTIEAVRQLFPSNAALPGSSRLQVVASGTNSFRAWLSVPTRVSAAGYLAWNDAALGDLELIRTALKRPYARMDGNYQQPFLIPIPNYITVRTVAQMLAQRTQCYLLLSQSEAALRELTLLHDLSCLLDAKPTGKPMTLVAAMINVAITGLYASTIADGLRLQAWGEPQLSAIEQQLKDINLLVPFVESMETERAGLCRTLNSTSGDQLAGIFGRLQISLMDKMKSPEWWLLIAAPQGWVYQNMAVVARQDQKLLESIKWSNRLIRAKSIDDLTSEMQMKFQHFSPSTIIAAIVSPNFLKATQTTARNQTMVNEALIACALERYRLAQGQYPETLDALLPKFTDTLPHDLIKGEKLKYRRTADGGFLLYSLGWNEKDDGGVPGKTVQEGDWVWETAKP